MFFHALKRGTFATGQYFLEISFIHSFFFLMFIYLFVYLNIRFVCIYTCTPEEGRIPFQMVVSLYGCWELNLGPVEEQSSQCS